MTKQRPAPQVSLWTPHRGLELSMRDRNLHGRFSRMKDMAEPGEEGVSSVALEAKCWSDQGSDDRPSGLQPLPGG